MKRAVFTFLLLPVFMSVCEAQIAVGTTTPDASARFQVDATSGTNDNPKGFLPPRVALTATNSFAPFSTIRPATGLLVYNTATAGTAPNNVTPGIYYYDGSKWQRVINQQPDATVTFDGTNPNTGMGATNFSGTQQSTDFIYVSNTNNSQWTYNGTAYVTYTPPASTPWYLTSGTSDAGSNKTGSIYRSGKVGIGGATTPNATLDIRTNPTSTTDPGAGYLGIGTTATAASSAGAGAVRYSTSNGGVLEYSDGASWKPLAASKAVAVYTEVHTDAGSSINLSSGSAFNEYGTITADNVVSVYGSTYGFFNGTGTGSSSDKWVAPFTGKFRITTNAYFNYNGSYQNPRLLALKNNSSICNITSANNTSQDIATSTSAIISLSQGDYINWKVEGSGAQIYRGLYHTFFRVESVE